MVEPFSRIGSNTILRAGVHLSHDAVIGDHVFLAPRVAMAGTGRIDSHCFVGVNATLRNNVTVAPRCVVGAGAVVTSSTEPAGLYVGVPARRFGRHADVKHWPLASPPSEGRTTNSGPAGSPSAGNALN